METMEDPDMMGLRIPPNSEEAEANVLGIILRDGGFLPKCIKLNLTTECFYVPRNRITYNAMIDITEKGGAPDLMGVLMTLRESHQLDNCGGVKAIEELYDQASVNAHGEFYARIVIEKAKLRRLIATCQTTITKAHENHTTTETILSEAKFAIHQISRPVQQNESTSELATRMADSYETARSTGHVGLVSRWFDVQKRIVVYQKGKITLVGARPGQGKTTFGMNEVLHKASIGIPSLVISIEMSRDELIERAIGDLMGLDLKRFKEGSASKEELQLFRKGGLLISKMPLYIEHSNYTIEQICALIREYRETKGIELAMIDYVQLIAPSEGKRFTNRNLEVGWTSQNLVHVGNETGVHLLVMSQLSRGMMSGPDKGEPELHHLRDSGSLEQDSYITMFLFQDPNSKGEWEDNQPTVIKISKHRGGPCPSRAMMTFQKSKQRFVGRDFQTLEPDKIAAFQKGQVKRANTNPEDEAPF